MNRFSDFTILLLFIVSALAGWGLLPNLSVRFLPAPQHSVMNVSYTWPQASPEEIERELTSPLESTFSLVENIRHIHSVSSKGKGVIELEATPNAEPRLLRAELATRIRQVYAGWPKEATFPIISFGETTSEAERYPILIYALSGPDPPQALYQYAQETMVPALALMPGIDHIQAIGNDKQEWELTYDIDRLNALGFTPQKLVQRLRILGKDQKLGWVYEGASQQLLSFHQPINDSLFSTSEWEGLPLWKVDNRIIYLGDVASLRLKKARPTSFYRINGQNSVRLLFFSEQGQNEITLARKVRNRLVEQAGLLPETYQLRLESDISVPLTREINKIKNRTILSLFILLFFILLIYRDVKFLIAILLCIWVNLGLAFIAYLVFSIDLHLYTFAGITVSFGIIIDNTLIIAHHLRKKIKIPIFPALFTSTATTLAALSVILFLPESWRQILLEFAAVLSINIAVSLLVARFFMPAIIGYLPGKNKGGQAALQHRPFALKAHLFYQRLLIILRKHRKLGVLATLLLFGLPVFLLPQKIEGWKVYNNTLGNAKYLEYVRPSLDKWLGGALRLFVVHVFEGSQYRSPKETILTMRGSMPTGATIEQMNAACKKIEAYLSNYQQALEQFTTQVNSGQQSVIQIKFKSKYQSFFPSILKDRLISFGLTVGGVKWSIYGVGRGFTNEGGNTIPQFRVLFYGYEKYQLANHVDKFVELLSQNPRVASIETQANINWWEKEHFNIVARTQQEYLVWQEMDMTELSEIMQHYNQYPPATLYISAYPLRLKEVDSERNDIWNLLNESQPVGKTVMNTSGVIQLKKVKTPSSIHKEDQQFLQMLTFEYKGEARIGRAYLEDQIKIMQDHLPLGFSIKSLRGESKEDAPNFVALLLLIAGLIFLIGSIHFESFRQAFLLVLLIPVSFIGIFLVFYIFRFPFDQGGYASFILVSGLSVNSLILLLNDYNYFKNRHPGKNIMHLYAKAYFGKATPIFLSVLTSIIGMIPFLIYGQQDVFWFALAVGTIGGLLFSLVVITIVTPLFLIDKRA